jgi:hypothetical protein
VNCGHTQTFFKLCWPCKVNMVENLTAKSLKLRERWITETHVQMQGFWGQIRQEIESVVPGALGVKFARCVNVTDTDYYTERDGLCVFSSSWNNTLCIT